MIEVLTAIGHDACRNCNGPITHYRGDLTRDPQWSHDATGERHCAGPVAQPRGAVLPPSPPDWDDWRDHNDAITQSGIRDAEPTP